MNRSLVRIWLAALLVILSPTVLPEDATNVIPSRIVISTGEHGGGYWHAGSRFKNVAAEMDLEVETLDSEGSLENLSRLLDERSPVNLVFAQADALQYFLNRNPAAREDIELLENLGHQCVFMVTGADGKYHTDKDIQDAGKFRLGLPDLASGVAVTFEYMVSQVPELENVELSYVNAESALDSLYTSEPEVDAVMMVSRPREHLDGVKTALQHPRRYRFIEMNDDRLVKEMPDGRSIYRSMKLALPGAYEPVETICVRGLVLLNKRKFSDDARLRLTELMNYHWMRIYATTGSH